MLGDTQGPFRPCPVRYSLLYLILLWALGSTRWSPEVPSNFSHSVFQCHCVSGVISPIWGGGWDGRDSSVQVEATRTFQTVLASLWDYLSDCVTPAALNLPEIGSVETCSCGWGLCLIPTVYPSYFIQCEQLCVCPMTRKDRMEVDRHGEIKSLTVVNWFVFYPPSPRTRGTK